MNRVFCFREDKRAAESNKRTAESSKRSGHSIYPWRERVRESERVKRRTSRWKDLYTASYICVEILSVLFYPNYSLLLCFVKINIYYQSKYLILQHIYIYIVRDKKKCYITRKIITFCSYGTFFKIYFFTSYCNR